MTDPAALVRGAKLRSGEYRVCLDPDLVDEHEALVARRESEKTASRDSLAGGNVAEIDEQLAELQERMEAATLTIKLRALPRPEFRGLMDKHPPRKDADGKLLHVEDQIGFAYDPFMNALVRESIVEPVLDAETLDMLLDEKLTDKQWAELTDTCWNLNRQTVSVPFSSAGSRRTGTSSTR